MAQQQDREKLLGVAPTFTGLRGALNRAVSAKLKQVEGGTDWRDVAPATLRRLFARHSFVEIDPDEEKANGMTMQGSFSVNPNKASIRVTLTDFDEAAAHVDISPAAAIDIAKSLIEYACLVSNLNRDKAFWTGPLYSLVNALTDEERIAEMTKRLLAAISQEIDLRAELRKIKK